MTETAHETYSAAVSQVVRLEAELAQVRAENERLHHELSQAQLANTELERENLALTAALAERMVRG